MSVIALLLSILGFVALFVVVGVIMFLVFFLERDTTRDAAGRTQGSKDNLH